MAGSFVWNMSLCAQGAWLFKKRKSVNVLGEPAETVSIALSLQHATHENLHRPQIQLLQRHFALKNKNIHLNSQSKHFIIPYHWTFYNRYLKHVTFVKNLAIRIAIQGLRFNILEYIL